MRVSSDSRRFLPQSDSNNYDVFRTNPEVRTCFINCCNTGAYAILSGIRCYCPAQREMMVGRETNHLSGNDAPTPDQVREQLDRILNSQDFGATPLRRKFLKYVVGETLEGRSINLKGVTIAIAVFGRDETFDQQNDPVVRVEARRLRQNLNDYYADAGWNDPVRIAIPKGGYKPVFDWQRTHESESENGGQTAEEVVVEAPAASQSEGVAVPAARRWQVPAVIALLVFSALTLWWASGTAWRPASNQDAAPADGVLAVPTGPSMVILPFLDLSSGNQKRHIAIGLTQQLTTEFVRFRNLRVFSLGTALDYNSGLADPHQLRRNLGVEYIVEGSVNATDTTIGITVRLIDAETAQYLWAIHFDKKLTPESIYAVQDEIVQEITGTIAGKYGVMAHSSIERSKRKAPENIDAYDCVLRYYDYQITLVPSKFESVKGCLEKAVELEPDFAEAWAVLANLYMQQKRFRFGDGTGNEIVNKAKSAIDTAILLDPMEPMAHLFLSNLYFTEGEFDKFRASGEHALRLNSNDSDILAHYGMRLAYIGDWERGLALVDKAIRLNPAHPHWYRFAKVIYFFERREYESALSELERVNMPRFLWSHVLRAAANGQLGRYDAANAAAKKLLAIRPGFEQEAEELIGLWHFTATIRQQLIEGIQKSGLRVGRQHSQ